MSASEDFGHGRLSSSPSERREEGSLNEGRAAGSPGMAALWVTLDALTVIVAAFLATLLKLHIGPLAAATSFFHGTLIYGRSMGTLLAFLGGFAAVLVLSSRRLNLYAPARLNSILHEQKLSAQACAISGLLLIGTLYLLRDSNIPRTIVLMTVVLAGFLLGLRRLVYRLLLYRRLSRGVGTRNVFIVGTGPEAQVLRHHLHNIRRLGYTFKGFIEFPDIQPHHTVPPEEIVGSFDELFEHTRKHFVDEIFFTDSCEPEMIKGVLEQASIHGVTLRVVPDIYDGLAWNSHIEYIGQFPTIPLHYGHVPELGLLFKRAFDMAFSSTVLILLSPLLVALAVVIKLDSPGPVFYLSERIGKKGRVFRCIKFRTMVCDADRRREDILHMNERDGVLFKVSNDPRITRLGRWLRKYSLDELPQFLNVLRGDMSVVGPRPPIASEVKKYELSHLRRLEVTPGITGLWQVQGRQDPSFASYVSLDVAYIDNWSLWLDFKIILRTIGVVLAGTGS
jgi:exopolysaccharide biosynthesis polyprenyl glycosylphosphotransferase